MTVNKILTLVLVTIWKYTRTWHMSLWRIQHPIIHVCIIVQWTIIDHLIIQRLYKQMCDDPNIAVTVIHNIAHRHLMRFNGIVFSEMGYNKIASNRIWLAGDDLWLFRHNHIAVCLQTLGNLVGQLAIIVNSRT